MKILKTIAFAAIFTALLVGLAPRPGMCTMSNARAMACKMACCKTPSNAPVCPLIRPAPAPDFIAAPAFSVKIDLPVVALVASEGSHIAARYAIFESGLYDTHDVVPWRTPQSIPAPPALA